MQTCGVRCIECHHFTLKDQPPEWRKVGAYRCPKQPPWEFRSAFSIRECRTFTPVKPEDLPARLAFEEKATQQ